MIALSSQLPWFVARASGLVAWGVLTASVVWGLALSSRVVQRRGLPPWLLDLHRYLASLALAFTAIHLAALWADSFVAFGPVELFVPMATNWSPGAVSWGIVALYLLVAVQVTSWLRRRLSKRTWHAVHMTSLPLFAIATVHGAQAGSDSANAALQWAGLAGCALVVFLVLYRVLAPRRPERVPSAARQHVQAVGHD
jgi:cytochrome b561